MIYVLPLLLGNLLLGHMEERCIALDDQKLVVVDCADNVSRKALCRAKKPNQDTEGFRENKSHRSKRDLKVERKQFKEKLLDIER